MGQKSNYKAPDQLGEGREREADHTPAGDRQTREGGWRKTVCLGLFPLPEFRVMDNSRGLFGYSSEKKACRAAAIGLVGGVVSAAIWPLWNLWGSQALLVELSSGETTAFNSVPISQQVMEGG